MPDREKVIKGLYEHGYNDCRKCPYWGDGGEGFSGCDQLARDALTLLKEQEKRIETLESLRRIEQEGR